MSGDACRFRGPYLPVGDVEWECLAHDTVLVRVAGEWGTPAKASDLVCPVAEPDWMLRVVWRAAPNMSIGGWCVQPAHNDHELASFARESVARHIAEVHNLWLELQDVDVIGRG